MKRAPVTRTTEMKESDLECAMKSCNCCYVRVSYMMNQSNRCPEVRVDWVLPVVKVVELFLRHASQMWS